MMKKLFCLLFLLLIVGPQIDRRLYAQETVVSEAQAKGLLNAYFNLLKKGDTSGILNLLTGPLLKRREVLLRDNPQYGEFLRERYKNAKFSVTGQNLNNNKRLALDVLIVIDSQEVVGTRLVFVNEGGAVKIFSENDLADSETE